VPRYFIDEVANDLTSYAQLNKYKAHFATIETGGKGRLIACPTAGWECKDQERLDLLGVDFVAVELGTEAAAWAEAQAAYARHEPFLLYAWTPHWIHAALDLVGIELPVYGSVEWPESGWGEDITFNYGNPASMSVHGDAAYLLGHMNLSNVEQSALVMAVDVDGRDIDEVVQEWVDANKDEWKHWLL
jgi:glycine betaine/proline transport system substrate-binding protein